MSERGGGMLSTYRVRRTAGEGMSAKLLRELARVFSTDAHHAHDTREWDKYGGRVSHHDERTGSVKEGHHRRRATASRATARTAMKPKPLLERKDLVAHRWPDVVALECTTVHMIGRGKRWSVKRWYVTLNFGGESKKLAVSKRVARWLAGMP